MSFDKSIEGWAKKAKNWATNAYDNLTELSLGKKLLFVFLLHFFLIEINPIDKEDEGSKKK